MKKNPMKKNFFFLMAILAFSLGFLALHTDCEASAIKKQGNSVYFGTYPQKEIKGKQLTKKIKTAAYDKKGYATVNGTTYRRITKKDARYIGKDDRFYQWKDSGYHYYKCAPIKWNIIGKANGNYILMADRILDCQQYHNSLKPVSWAGSCLRDWLNDAFYKNAFTATERKLLKKVSVSTPKNSAYNTPGGKKSIDRVYLLSTQEAQNKKYGFRSNQSRKSKTTDYAQAMGALTRDTGMGCRWPRTMGKNTKYAANILSSGKILTKGYQVTTFDGVRPVIQISTKKIK